LVFLFRPAPKNEDEMMALIFEYIDRIFSIVEIICQRKHRKYRYSKTKRENLQYEK
jgi:hypothetical protein